MTELGAKSAKQPVPQTWKKVLGGVLIALGALTFFLAQSSLWVSNSFFSEDNFVGTVEEVLKTEESRTAVANTIVHSALQNNPVAEQLIGKQTTALVAGLLGSDLVGQVFDRLAHRTYAYLTSSDRQDLVIDLTAVKDPLTTIVSIAEKNFRDVKFDPAEIPDSIMLLESDTLPDFSGYIRTVLFASGLLWLGMIASFTAYIFMNRTNWIRSVYVVGWSMLIVSAIALLTGPFIPPAIASLVNLVAIRSVVEDLGVAFLHPFQIQLLSSMVIIALILLVLSLRKEIQRGFVKLMNLFK